MILKNGKVGLAYIKKGSRVNGTIVESIEIFKKEVQVKGDIFKLV